MTHRKTLIFLGALAVLLLSGVTFLQVSPARAATNRYVATTCANFPTSTPCYPTIETAVTAAANGDSIVILENLGFGYYDHVNSKIGITIRGNTAAISVPALRIPQVNDWTIRDMATDAVIVADVTTRLRIENVHANGIYVKPTTDMNASIEIIGNTLPTAPNNGIYYDMAVLGAEGKTIAGSITLQNNVMGAANIFVNVNNTTPAVLAANVLIDNNTASQTIDVGIRRNPGTSFVGVGNITGNVTFSNNTVTNTSQGLNVTLDANTHGVISGNVSFSGNRADKIACITIDSAAGFNNGMSGSLTIGGNVGEYIEVGFFGDFTGTDLNIQNNNLTFKGGVFGSVITVRANTFSAGTTIRVGDNSGAFALELATFIGANNATVSVYRNLTTYYIGYGVKTTNGGVFWLTDNTVLPGPYPAWLTGNPNAGLITMVAETGAITSANLYNNTMPKLFMQAGTNLSGSVIIQNNVVQKTVQLVAQGALGSGTVSMISNRLGSISTDFVNITRVNTTLTWNAILGQLNSGGATVNAQRNWWGCNEGPGNPACQPVAAVNATPYLQFEAKAVCTGANNKIVAAYNVTKDNTGAYYLNAAVPGTVTVGTSTGTVSLPNPRALKGGFGWNSTLVNVSANATATLSMTLDRQTINVVKQCQTRTDTIGVFRGGQFLLNLANDSSAPDITASFGGASWLPVTGDWNADGVDTIGAYDGSTGVFYLRNTNTSGSAEMQFVMGNPGDTPMAGRWDVTMANDGVGVFRPTNGIIYLKRDLTSGFSDYYMVLGNPGDMGLAGDWDGDGYDGPAVFRPSQGIWYLSNNGTANGIIFDDGFGNFGPLNNNSLRPVSGDWDADGVSGIGYLLTNTFNLRNTPTGAGAANLSFVYGQAGDRAIAGHWTSAAFVPPPLLVGGNPVLVRPGWMNGIGGDGGAE